MISSRFPQFELSTIKVLKRLGFEPVLLDDVTCCPEPISMRMLDFESWHTVAARNICLAEERGLDMLTICNGCNWSLFRTNEDLKADVALKKKINENLKETGKAFLGQVSVKSMLRFLYQDVGESKIRKIVKTPLKNIRVAVHYGCHIFDEIRSYDDPKHPKSLKALVSALGADVLEYPSEMLCCGGHMTRYMDEEFSHEIIKEKLTDLSLVRAECLVVICPYCFLQYDLGQMLLANRMGNKPPIPVLYYTQLLGLALGYNAVEMGIDMHKVKANQLVEKLSSS